MLFSAGVGARQAADAISVQEAYHQLLQHGLLESVTILGDIDLARLEAPTTAQPPQSRVYRFRRVRFEGPVTLTGALGASLEIVASDLQAGLNFVGCSLSGLALRDSTVHAAAMVRDCRFDGPVAVEGTSFNGPVRFEAVEFTRRSSFRRAVFADRAAFLGCRFATAETGARKRLAATGFSEAEFHGPALFNESVFHTPARFHSVLFADDAAFLKSEMPEGASFGNAHFLGDAEFRFCRIGNALFSDREQLTLFAGRADFRGCSIEHARFDYAELRGESSFVDVSFGDGGASFSYVNLAARADFNGITSKGPIDFEHAYAPKLEFSWRDIRDAVLASDPSVRTLEMLRAHAASRGDDAGKLELDWLRQSRLYEVQRASPLPSPVADLSGFIDRFAERLTAHVEWLVWGWPTGYGTKLGRILLLALVVWLLASVPASLASPILARVGPRLADCGDDSPVYKPIEHRCLTAPAVYPTGRAARLRLALCFTFRVLFKVGARGIRFVGDASDQTRAHTRAWQRWFQGLWLLGSGLLLLITLTLANTSPMINRLIGELFPV